MANHPDLAAEQAYLDRAYALLEASREAATRLTSMVEVGRGGTEQARYEREVILDIGGQHRSLRLPWLASLDRAPSGQIQLTIDLLGAHADARRGQRALP